MNLRGYVRRLTSLTEHTLEEWAEKGNINAFDEVRRFVMTIGMSVLAGFDNPYISPEGFEKANQLYLVRCFSVLKR